MLKKLFTILSLGVMFQVNTYAQQFTYSYGLSSNDTVNIQTLGMGIKTDEGFTNTLDIDAYINNASNASQVIKWTWVSDSTNTPVGWVLTGVCDNVNCRASYSDFYNHIEQSTDPIAVAGKTLFEPRIYCPTTSPNGTGFYRFKIRSFNAADLTTETGSDFYTFIVTKNTTGISTIAIKDSRVLVYPNPATNSLKVFTDKALNSSKASIIDITGKTVMTTNIAKGADVTELNINTLAKGNYIVNINNEKGELITARQFVKK
jgi:hypothetical protein